MKLVKKPAHSVLVSGVLLSIMTLVSCNSSGGSGAVVEAQTQTQTQAGIEVGLTRQGDAINTIKTTSTLATKSYNNYFLRRKIFIKSP